jgi:hypothetical protein
MTILKMEKKTMEEQESTRTLEIEVAYHHDAVHGWYKVDKAIVIVIGIADKISCCSYEDGTHVYLEEDRDANLFFDTVKALGPRICTLKVLPAIYRGDCASIRELPSWRKSLYGGPEGGSYDRI